MPLFPLDCETHRRFHSGYGKPKFVSQLLRSYVYNYTTSKKSDSKVA